MAYSRCDTSFDLDKHLVMLMSSEPFFAEISRHVAKVPAREVGTAGVTYDKDEDEFVLFWNPEFVAKLSDLQIKNLLVHEFYHIIFGHLYARKKTPHTIWNIATDLAINSIIVENHAHNTRNKNETGAPLPTGGVIPGHAIEIDRNPNEAEVIEAPDPFTVLLSAIVQSMPKLQASEFYYDDLMNRVKCPKCGKKLNSKQESSSNSKGSQKSSNADQEGDDSDSTKDSSGEGQGDANGQESDSSGQGSDSKQCNDSEHCTCDHSHSHGAGEGEMPGFDDHKGWDDIPDEVKDFVRERAKDIIKKAVNRADHANSWGSVPSEIREIIRSIVSNIIDWRAVLRQFIGYANKGNRRNSLKRINKRYPYIHPGTTRGYSTKLLIAMDQSGSVNDSMIEMFFAELASLTRRVTIDVVAFDTHCYERNITVWKKGTTIERKRVRCGGTDFDAPTHMFNENLGRWDGMIIMTDGAAPEPGPCKGKRAWVLAKGTNLIFNSNETQIFLDESKHTGSDVAH